jgi:tetratricopeptide (TPR) repeat protein
VLEEKAGDAQALERRAFAYRSMKKYEEAIADYTKLVDKSPKDAEALRNRGYAYALSGDHTKAEADYEKVLKLKPGDADAETRLKAAKAKAAAAGGVPAAAPGASPSTP